MPDDYKSVFSSAKDMYENPEEAVIDQAADYVPEEYMDAVKSSVGLASKAWSGFSYIKEKKSEM